MTDPQDILSVSPLRVRYLAGRSDTLVVCFSGVGTQRWQEPDLEFREIAADGGANHVLFVTDASRCWLNHPRMVEWIDRAIRTVVQQTGVTRIVALGNSMGGSMALIMSRFVAFDVVVAIVPQVSVQPQIVPEETRWRFFTRQIESFRFPVIEGLRPDRTQYVILHGGNISEQRHALRFPTVPGTLHYVFPAFGHKLAAQLKTRGKLAPLVRLALAGKRGRVRKLLLRLGAQPRNVFAANLAVRADRAADGSSGTAVA